MKIRYTCLGCGLIGVDESESKIKCKHCGFVNDLENIFSYVTKILKKEGTI